MSIFKLIVQNNDSKMSNHTSTKINSLARPLINSNILLVKLPYKNSYYSFYNDLPAGIGILSEVLSDNNIIHDVYDMQIDGTIENFYKKIETVQPDIIGFSMLTFRYLDNYKLITNIKQKFPNIIIAVGGPHASIFRENIIKECPVVDIVVVHEGEDILVELCQGKPLHAIKGIIYNSSGSIIRTEPRALIQDLDKYPFPKYKKFNLSNYQAIPILTSRGCPYKCIYCPSTTTIGNKWRARKAESVIRELTYWAERNTGYEVQIVDDNFTLKMDRVKEICDGIKQNGAAKKLNIVLGSGVRADRVNEELLTLLKEIGVNTLAFGVESGDEQVLKTLKKGESLETIDNAIKLACDLDFNVHLFFVIGAPGETEKDVMASIKLSQKYPVIDVAFYHLIPFPETELYRWVKENDRFRFKNPEYLNHASHWVNEPLFTTDELDVETRKKLYHLANTSGRKYTHRVITKRLAKKLAQKIHVHAAIFYPIIAIARHPIIKSLLNKIGIAKLLTKIQNRYLTPST